jgi:hypothetical protein
MARKNKEDNNKYWKKYYHSHPELKSRNAAGMRLKYWREKLIKLLKISLNATIRLDAINGLTEKELREECNKLNDFNKGVIHCDNI